jgi:hypothetical protein
MIAIGKVFLQKEKDSGVNFRMLHSRIEEELSIDLQIN